MNRIIAARYFSGILSVQPCRNAGHSKWANIKHVKSLKDGQRAKDLTRLTSMIRVAIREGGGGDPKTNTKLSHVINQAKDVKLPMASIEKALQNSQPGKDAKSGTVAVRGPGGCVLIVDLSSVSLNRTKNELNTILRKHKGLLFTEPTTYFYNQKGVIRCTAVDNVPAIPENLEKAIDDGIEAGAEEVNFQDDIEHGKILEFLTEPDPRNFFKVKQTLEKMNYTIGFSDVEYLPVQKVELSETDLIDAGVLCDKLEAHPDVVKVYDNIA